MADLQFRYESDINSYEYKEKSEKDTPTPSTIKRIFQDISNLKNSLPFKLGI